jgi:hypothetical protein
MLIPTGGSLALTPGYYSAAAPRLKTHNSQNLTLRIIIHMSVCLLYVWINSFKSPSSPYRANEFPQINFDIRYSSVVFLTWELTSFPP